MNPRIVTLAVGAVAGLLAAPLVKKSLTKIQPKATEVLESLKGNAEKAAKKGSDLLAVAKQKVVAKAGLKKATPAPKPTQTKTKKPGTKKTRRPAAEV